jgi:N-acetylglucosaminyldiphosphoundecaprenol N-acetyl-beta-D-mannosaminyltransferase
MILSDPTSVLGISFPAYSLQEIVMRVKEARTPYWIATVNPEILVTASEQPMYAACLRAAPIRVVDGFGLWAILRARGVRRPRVTGGTLVSALLEEAQREKWTVALLGAAPGVAKKAAEAMQKKYPSILFFAESMGRVDEEGREDAETKAARERCAAHSPQLVFVAFGHPKQERWIERTQATFRGAHAIVGIGGVVDVWAGERRRVPAILGMIGLEWLWRFWQEPSRRHRMWRATGVFLWKVWREEKKKS